MSDEVSKEVIDKVLEVIELSKATGKIRKGTNEVTKSVERGEAKIVALANDVSPPEIIMHIPMLCKEKEIPCITVGTKEELGAAAGLQVGSVSVAVVQEGEGKQVLKEVLSNFKSD